MATRSYGAKYAIIRKKPPSSFGISLGSSGPPLLSKVRSEYLELCKTLSAPSAERAKGVPLRVSRSVYSFCKKGQGVVVVELRVEGRDVTISTAFLACAP